MRPKVNLRSLFAIIAMFSLLGVLLGVARLGVDLWDYHDGATQDSSPEDCS